MATWPTIIDDDGSGTTGTVLDKALFDQVKAYVDVIGPMRLSGILGVSIPVAGVDNFYATGQENAVIWTWSPTLATGITGIKSEADGTQHLIVNVTNYPITLANQHPSSISGNRLICPGFSNYVLSTWNAIWIVYLEGYTSWLLIKP